MVKVEKALEIILSSIRMLKDEEVPLLHSLDRILACDIYAKVNLPPFDNSAMDGYAVRAKDTKGASKSRPQILNVTEDVPAGYVARRKLRKNEAIRIMTGAAMPDSADSVIMVEYTQKTENREQRTELVKIFKEAKPGENVRKVGEDIKKRQKVLSKGCMLRAQELGMLAALGISKVKVAKRPRVGILATGDELVGVEERLKKGKIRNSNSLAVSGQVSKCGAIPIDLGIVKDTRSKVRDRIYNGLKKDLDMLLVLGGISVGDYDFVKDVLLKLGMKMRFWRVAIRPGKPLAFGIIKNIPVFGLPGNPVSSSVTFEEFVRPSILKMQGARHLFGPGIWAILEENFPKKKELRYFLRTKVREKNGKYYASLTGPQGSGIMSSLVLADGIAIGPEGVDLLKKGTPVYVQLLRHGYDGGTL